MKKNNLLKVLTISFLIFVVLSWIIPAGTFTSGSFTEGEVAPLGILDLIYMPLSTITSYAGYGILILIIGGFYGVLEATGVFDSLVAKMSKKYEKKAKGFMIFTTILFALLSSLTGSSYVLLVLVPLFAAVLLKLGYDKISALMATVGSILVGSMACTYGFNVNGYINYYLGVNDLNNQILVKFILLVLLTVLLIMFVLKHSKKVTVKNLEVSKTKEVKVTEDTKVVETAKKEAKKTTTKKGTNNKKTGTRTTSKKTTSKKTTTKKSTKKTTGRKRTAAFAKTDDVKVIKNVKERSVWPFVVILTLVIIFLLVACYNWRYAFNIDVFETMYESIIAVTVNDFAIFKNIIGTFNPLGYWAVNEISIILVFMSLLIAWIYSLKMNDFVNAFKEGAKKYLGVAFYVVMANIIVGVLIATQNSGSMYFTIADAILGWTKDFNVFTTGLVSFIGGFFFNDMPYLVSSIATALTTKITDSTLYPLVGFVMQTMHGFAMLFLPTSAILLAGLAYFEVSYKEWMKYIWKFLIQVLVVTLIVCVIVSMII